ncbi:MAG: symmetrical bis(5'-nucleosyl)-tetraphosphatase [Planctomycetota bacterium]|nr:MAG: symmetrical bis(5'-nucleosyl)-tetraphosphatase [Planctomycetota bacterium]
MAIYALGDVQGCFRSFQALLQRIDFQAGRDRLWLAGDVVNRGPGSLPMLRWLFTHRDQVRLVLGNHDLKLLSMAAGLQQPNERDCLQEVLEAPDCRLLLSWLRQQPLIFQHKGKLLVHAGLLPAWSVEQALGLASELHQILRGPEYTTLLKAWKKRSGLQWPPKDDPWERRVTALNALTTLRLCQPDGSILRGYSGGPERAPAWAQPWYAAKGRRWTDALVLFGHWASLGLKLTKQWWALDSGCVWGGKLSAVRLKDQAVFQVPLHPEDEAGRPAAVRAARARPDR